MLKIHLVKSHKSLLSKASIETIKFVKKLMMWKKRKMMIKLANFHWIILNRWWLIVTQIISTKVINCWAAMCLMDQLITRIQP